MNQKKSITMCKMQSYLMLKQAGFKRTKGQCKYYDSGAEVTTGHAFQA
jgi:hypothetical protein